MCQLFPLQKSKEVFASCFTQLQLLLEFLELQARYSHISHEEPAVFDVSAATPRAQVPNENERVQAKSETDQ